MKNEVHLLVASHEVENGIAGLEDLLQGPLQGVFGGVHLRIPDGSRLDADYLQDLERLSQIQVVIADLPGHNLSDLKRIQETGAAAVSWAPSAPFPDGPELRHLLSTLADETHEYGMELLALIPGSFPDQTGLSPLVDLVYDTVVPVAVPDLIQTFEAGPLFQWLSIAPTNTVTLLGSAANESLNRHRLTALALQFFSPGIPFILHSLVSEETPHPHGGRALLDLIEFRNSHPAFSGRFHAEIPADGELLMSWDLGIEFARLHVDLALPLSTVSHSSPDGKETYRVENTTDK